MIVITKIEFHTVIGRNTQIVNHPPPEAEHHNGAIPYTGKACLTERICGREYRNPVTGECVVLGVATAAAAPLGLQFEAYENMARL